MDPPTPERSTPALTEIDKYKAEPPAPRDMPHRDVLLWWKQAEPRFPNLARMVRQYLSCPASSASVERIFSITGRLFDDLSQAMKEENLEERMWAKQHVLNSRKKGIRP